MSSVPFKPNSTFCVVGCTGSGKTVWVQKVLENLKYIFEDASPVEVMYCYGVHQKLYEEIELHLGSLVQFHKGIPTQDEIEQFTPNQEHRLLILDDLISDVVKSETMQDLFCQFCHHRKLSVIFVSQNLLQQGKFARTIALNTHYVILLKNMRNRSQIAHLGRELFPKNPHLLIEAYEDCVQVPYSYLVVDLSPHSEDQYRLRTHIFPGEDTVIYTPNPS